MSDAAPVSCVKSAAPRCGADPLLDAGVEPVQRQLTGNQCLGKSVLLAAITVIFSGDRC
ncbi:MAG: hypothetical protein ABI580_09560 [Burkholderiaceae bacterium]